MSETEGSTFALFPLRLGLAAVFAAFGYNKLADLSGTIALFEGWGIPLAGTAATLVAIAEFFGGLGLLLGVLPRFSSAVLSVVMVTAMAVVTVPGPVQAGWGIDVALLAGLVTVLVNGPGRPTIWSVLGAPDHSLWSWLKKRLGPSPNA